MHEVHKVIMKRKKEVTDVEVAPKMGILSTVYFIHDLHSKAQENRFAIQ